MRKDLSLDRIYDVWSNTAEEEMLILLQEFAQDYEYEQNFLWALRRVEQLLLDGWFDDALEMFEKNYPIQLRFSEYALFRQLVEEMRDEQYYIY